MKNLFFLLTILLSTGAFAQTITYSYDAAGNRVSRAYVVNLRSSEAGNTIPPDSLDVSVMIGTVSVTVYPNPTRGDLAISVAGLTEDETLGLRLYDPQGHQLLLLNVSSGTTHVDLSAFPAGWYLLRAQTKVNTLDFKIIKQ